MHFQKSVRRTKFKVELCEIEADLNLARTKFKTGNFLESFDIYEQLYVVNPDRAVKILAEVYDLYQEMRNKDRYHLYQARQINFNINASDKVIDIGSGHIPFPLATHLSDITLENHDYGRASAPFKHIKGKPVFECNIENMPFEDKEFDFIYCSHVIEHARHPEKACEEIMRVAKRGYIETPTKGKDIFLNSAKVSNHQFWVEAVNGNLIFTEYTTEEIEGMQCDILLNMHCEPKTDREKAFSALIYLKPNLFNTMFTWEDEFYYEVRGPADVKKKNKLNKNPEAYSIIPDTAKEIQNAKNENTRSCLFVDTYYSAFLESHYQNNPNLIYESYAHQKASLNGGLFGNSDYYCEGLKKSGWDAEKLIINCKQLQTTWIRENNSSARDLQSVAVEQIKQANPRVTFFHDLNLMTKDFLDAVRPFTELMVGQISTVILNEIPFDSYDLLFSSFPHYIKRFRDAGLTAHYMPLAFDPRILQHVNQFAFSQRPIECSFAGGISKLHLRSYKLLELLVKESPIEFWGYGAETLSENSPVRDRHHGYAWGKDMFNILSASKININRHGEVAENYANNMHLFEATGCGTLLITDYKDNLCELFEIGKEVVAYRSPEECAALVQYYLTHQKEAEEIAKEGQSRTLRDHTHIDRMGKTAQILEDHFRK